MDWMFRVGVVVAAYIAVSVVGAYVIKAILRRYEGDIVTGGLRGAGMAIGIIERVDGTDFRSGRSVYSDNHRICRKIYCEIQRTGG